MDERDANLFGVEIVRRDMAFRKGYVTCTNCECNYDASKPGKTVKTFCQIYSRPVDPSDTERNIFLAESCDQWIPIGLDRNKVITPAHTYRYESGEKG
jgi:hypothetical protein